MQQEIEFYEKQVCPIWIKIAISIIILAAWIMKLIAFAGTSISILNFVSYTLIFAGALLFIFFAFLKTIIDSNGIYVKILPMLKFKLYDWENVSSIVIKKQRFFGYSQLSFLKFRVNSLGDPIEVYNFAGRYCLQFVWKKSCAIRVSTNQPIEIEDILMKLGKINQQADS